MASRQPLPHVQLGGQGVLTGRVACEAASTCVTPPGAPALPVDPVPTGQTADGPSRPLSQSSLPFPSLRRLPSNLKAPVKAQDFLRGSLPPVWGGSPSPLEKHHLVLEASVSFLDWLLLTHVFYLLSLYDGLFGCVGLWWVFLF